MEFMYGYAVTGWAAQGSQWGKVVVLEENFPYDKEEHKKFLYTCCTRATDKLVLVINK
jgi:DNA helicase IV